MSVLDRLHASISDITTFAIVALAVGGFKILTTPGRHSIKSVLLNLSIGTFAGVIAGGACLELGHGDYAALVATSLSSLLAREFLDIIRNRQALDELAKRAAENLVDKATK